MTAIDYQTPVAVAPSTTWRDWLQRLGPVVGFVFVFGLFSLLRPRQFLSPGNLQLILLQTAVVGTAALGMTLIIISGGIDLTPGSNVALCTVVIAVLLVHGCPPLVAAAGGIVAGALVGLSTGAMVVGRLGEFASAIMGVGIFLALFSFCRLPLYIAIPSGIAVFAGLAYLANRFVPRVPLSPFIVTLGLWGSVRGLAQQVAGSGTVYPRATWLNKLLVIPGRGHRWMILPTGVWLTIALAIFVTLLLRYTKFGRHVFAIGSNEQTARLCGINVTRTKLLIYALAAAFVGIAGLLQFSFLTMGDSTSADGMELKIIAAVVIGGASLNGGEGSVLGSMIGALMMTGVANGCAKMGWPNYVELEVTGAIIIIAVWLDGLRHLRSS